MSRVLLSLLLPVFAAAAEPYANQDWGFEEATETGTPGWHVEGGGGAWQVTRENPHAGKTAMVFQGTADPLSRWVRLVSDPIPVRTGDCADFVVWVRSEGKPAAYLSAYVAGKMGKEWQPLEPKARNCESRFWNGEKWFSRGYAVFVPHGVSEVRLEVTACAGEPVTMRWFIDDFTCRIVSFAQYAESKRSAERLKDTVLIGVDTLAQSVLGCYGARQNWTPNMDALAAEGRRYDHVTTAATWTRPSFVSIMTSLYPSQHTAENFISVIPDELPMLAEVMKQRGYFTAGFVFSGMDEFLGSQRGFAQGFDVFFQSRPKEEAVWQAVLRFLDTNGEYLASMSGGGLFLFVHIFEPHTPYVNHTPELLRNKGLLGTIDIRDDELGTVTNMRPEQCNEEDVKYVRAAYAGEINYSDRIVGEVLARLRRLGLYETANIVLCSDHGESFGEKPYIWGHCEGYETCSRVPLILRFPGRTEPGIRDTQTLVSNLDIMPTIVNAAGATLPAHCEGRDLLNPDAVGRTSLYGISEDKMHGYMTVRDSQYKLIAVKASERQNPADKDSPTTWKLYAPESQVRYELYDLTKDPFELTDLAQTLPNELQRLRRVMDEHCVHTGIASTQTNPAGPQAENRGLSDESRRELEAQGYGRH